MGRAQGCTSQENQKRHRCCVPGTAPDPSHTAFLSSSQRTCLLTLRPPYRLSPLPGSCLQVALGGALSLPTPRLFVTCCPKQTFKSFPLCKTRPEWQKQQTSGGSTGSRFLQVYFDWLSWLLSFLQEILTDRFCLPHLFLSGLISGLLSDLTLRCP